MNINSFDGNSNDNESYNSSYNNRTLNSHNKYKIIETNGNYIDLLKFNSFIIFSWSFNVKESTIYKFQSKLSVSKKISESNTNQSQRVTRFSRFSSCTFSSFLFSPKKTKHLTRVIYQSRGSFLAERLAIKLPAMANGSNPPVFSCRWMNTWDNLPGSISTRIPLSKMAFLSW